MFFYRCLIEIGNFFVDSFWQNHTRGGPQSPYLITALRTTEPELRGHKTIVNKGPVVTAQN